MCVRRRFTNAYEPRKSQARVEGEQRVQKSGASKLVLKCEAKKVVRSLKDERSAE